jgi:transmembrane sensor
VSKHKSSPLTGEILDAAAGWFVEFNEGKVSQAQREAFIDWLKTSPEHVRAYLQVAAHWEDARALNKPSLPAIEELVVIGRESAGANVIAFGIARSKGARQAGVAESPLPGESFTARSQARLVWRSLLVAGLVVATLGTGTSYWFQYQRGMYATQPGEQRSITLEDGSAIELNSRSKIRVAFHPNERDIELLSGQALFRVAKDHARPFVVQSGATRVLAVGTQFDVYKHANGTTVTVVEGRVAIFPFAPPPTGTASELLPVAGETAPDSAPQLNVHPRTARANPRWDAAAGLAPALGDGMASPNEILLAAGEQLTVSKDSLQRDEHPDVAAATAWTQQQIVFNATPLSQVAEEFNRYNTRHLVITDSRIADTRVSGVFSSTNPDSLLRGLDAMNGFSIRVMPDRIEISAR